MPVVNTSRREGEWAFHGVLMKGMERRPCHAPAAPSDAPGPACRSAGWCEARSPGRKAVAAGLVEDLVLQVRARGSAASRSWNPVAGFGQRRPVPVAFGCGGEGPQGCCTLPAPTRPFPRTHLRPPGPPRSSPYRWGRRLLLRPIARPPVRPTSREGPGRGPV